ncbi:MAG: hypothetical protein SPL30_06640 [Succinivibrio sp.]|jgi:hypothetical protein|nr:hypothetical protein [Succinivibrio sp.]
MKLKIFTAALLCGCALSPAFADDQEQTEVLRQISSKLTQSLDTMRQWSQTNQEQTDVLRQSAERGMDMAVQDHEKPNVQSWRDMDRLTENSLGLLHASSSLWETFGTLNEYLASFMKAEAWQECMEKGKECSFRAVLEHMDSNSIEYATQAAKNASNSSAALKEQIAKLERLSGQARSAEGLGAGLDTLSQVNAASAASLMDLSNSINTMLRVQAHEAASEHNQALAESEGSRHMLEGGKIVSSGHFEMRFSDNVPYYGY